MKRLISALAFLLLVGYSSFATEYYVSKNGSDKNTGKISAPFLTIQKAAEIMKAGDICYISAGIYAESITVKSSGTEDAPIVFKAATDSDDVVITGSDPIPVSKWEKESTHIFKVKVDLTLDHENQVFLGTTTMVVARWPNIGDDLLVLKTSFMDAGSSPENIIDNDMPDYDYTGGHVWVHAPKYWYNWTGAILSQGKKSLGIQNLSPQRNHAMKDRLHVADEGSDYYVFGIKDALDADNEWFYDKKKKELFVYRSNGKLPDAGYFVKRRMNAFDFSNRKHIELHRLNIIGASILTNEESESIMLDRLKILYPYFSAQKNEIFGKQSGKGVIFRGKKCTIQHSEVAYSSGSCLTLLGEENMVFNCYIHDADFIGGGESCVTLGGKGNIVSHNTLTRAGRTVLAYSGMYKALIQNNDMSHSGKLTSDLGLTYGNLILGGNSEVRYNLMHDNDDNHLDMGLYYDHGTQSIISHHNIVWGVGFSSFHTNNYAAYHLVYNNTFISEDNGFLSTWGNQYGFDLLECRYANNLMKEKSILFAGNYYWNSNITGYRDFDENNVMRPAKEGLGKGIYIEGITAAPKGTKPGIGAIEYEGMTFKAGHNFENPPQNVNFERSKPVHRNLIENGAFEKEDKLSPWKLSAGAELIEHARQTHQKVDTAVGKMGSYSIELVEEHGEVSQKIDKLIPGEEYTFIGHLRVQVEEAAITGIRYPDDTEFFSPQVEPWLSPLDTVIIPIWRRSRLSFIVPEGVTSIEVFARRISSGKGTVYVDDFGLVKR